MILNIVSYFTGPRYKPEIEWSRSSLVHNIFRLWELIAGRKYGIRCESSVYQDDYVTVYEFYTWEAVFAHYEGYIRGIIPKLIPKVIHIPVLQPATSIPFQFKNNYLFAIGYDNSTKSDTGGTSTQSVSYAVSGSNRFLVIDASCGNDVSITTATYNSVSGTFIVKSTASGFSVQQANLYGLVAPATGTNTLTVTSASSDCRLGAASYTGVDQTTPTTNATTSSNDGTSSGSLTITPTNSNSWLFGAFNNNNGDDNIAGSGTTVRQSSGTGYTIADTNSAVSGSTTISVSGAGTASLRRNAGFAIKQATNNFTLTADQGSFTLTGQDALLKRGLRMIAAAGSFTLTGFNVALNRGYGIAVTAMSFVLTGFNAVLSYTGWTKDSKNTSASFTNDTKNTSTSWTNNNK